MEVNMTCKHEILKVFTLYCMGLSHIFIYYCTKKKLLIDSQFGKMKAIFFIFLNHLAEKKVAMCLSKAPKL